MLKMTWTKDAEGRVVGAWMAANTSENANGVVATILRADRFASTSGVNGQMSEALAA